MAWMGERKDSVLQESISQSIDCILFKFGNDPTRLIDILLEVQSEMDRQYLSKEVASYISRKLDIPLSRTYDVISFYGALSDTPRGRFVIQYCDSVVCRVTGHSKVEEVLLDCLGLLPHTATPDGRLWLEGVPCFGACDISPALRINGVVYGRLDCKQKVEEALRVSGATT